MSMPSPKQAVALIDRRESLFRAARRRNSFELVTGKVVSVSDGSAIL
jgi:hypothetical protein